MMIAKATPSGASCMRFASTTISKAFLFIFCSVCKEIKRQRNDCEYAQVLIKPSALEFWASIATGFSGVLSPNLREYR